MTTQHRRRFLTAAGALGCASLLSPRTLKACLFFRNWRAPARGCGCHSTVLSHATQPAYSVNCTDIVFDPQSWDEVSTTYPKNTWSYATLYGSFSTTHDYSLTINDRNAAVTWSVGPNYTLMNPLGGDRYARIRFPVMVSDSRGFRDMGSLDFTLRGDSDLGYCRRYLHNQPVSY